MKELSKDKIAKNVILSIGAQLISLMVSFLLNLVVPKFLTEAQYANWQIYVLYVGYVGILHFGMLDGLMLRYAQYDYEELDKKAFRSQFLFLIILMSVISTSIFCFSIFNMQGEKKIIVCLVALGIIIKNMYTYTSYLFQMTNRIDRYVNVVILDRVCYGIFIVILLFLHVQNFYWYCLADLVSNAVAIIIGAKYNKGLYFGKVNSFKLLASEVYKNTIGGFILLVANWSASFLVDSAKMIIQWNWDKLIFGKISFAYSITNLFMTFITATSIVLFPSLKRIEDDKLPELYKEIRGGISLILFTMMFVYFPVSILLKWWMPNYIESLSYLGILLPTIIYTSKIGLLTNNYFKAYRKEKTMLIINLVVISLAIIGFWIFASVFKSLVAILIWLVCMIMLRSILSEIYISKIIKINFYLEFLVEFCMTILFIVSTSVLSFGKGMILYFVCLMCYYALNKRVLKSFLQYLKKITDKIKLYLKV